MEQSVRFTFGKYNGKTVAEVAKIDPSYFTWFLKQPGFQFKYRLLYQEINKLGVGAILPTSTPMTKMKSNNDPSETEFKFGKHKGKKVVDIYRDDKSYIDWLTKQADFATKYKEVQEAIVYCQTNNITKTVDIEGKHVDVHYGDYINFPESTIRIALQKLDVSAIFINNFLLEKSDNINETISIFADNYSFQDVKNFDELKVVLAWKYGICLDTFQAYFIEGIKNNPNNLFIIDGLISRLCEKLKPEDKVRHLNDGTPMARKICKSLPFLFTPAFFQLRLLGLNNKEIGKIYRCRIDNVMFRSKIVFPDKIDQVSPFFRFDWRADFYAFIYNPYAYYNINLFTCDGVIRSTERNITFMKYERDLGMISRKIYENVKKNKWTCTPTWAIKNMNYENSIEMLQDNYGLLFELDSVYLKHIREEEMTIANFISLKLKTEGIEYKLIDNDQFSLSDEQLSAVKSAMSQPITVINALSGTGKTTIIKEIVRQITSDPLKANKFVICSFTAKAVKRVQEVLGHHLIIKTKAEKPEIVSCVRTIHSLMNAIKKKSVEEPEYIIIDESTMVSLSLFAELVNLLHDIEFNLIMLGDINQLPPIKYGRPFEDMINSGSVEGCRLTKNFRVRQGSDDPIIINANNIINSPFYTVTPAANFNILNTNEERFEQDIKNLLKVKNISNVNAKQHKFITNTNDNNTKLNKIISDEIGDKVQKKSISCWMKEKKITMNYAIGDPVVFTKNGTYPGTFNGDQGVITGFSNTEHNQYLIVTMDKFREEEEDQIIRVRLYPDREGKNIFFVRNLLLGYSITVHKSQGSEYDNSYVYLDGLPSKSFNNKRLSYTAITRSKKECTVIEGEVGLFERISRENQSAHYGNLDRRINEIIEGERKDNRENDLRTISNFLTLINRPSK